MEITLGPWTAEMSVAENERKTLPAAMGTAAKDTAKRAGFTAKDATLGKPAKKGFTISGKVTSVTKEGRDVTVRAIFTLWADGTFSNVAPLKGEATASGGMTAEDALVAVTESRVKQLLDAVKSGRAQKAR